MTQQEIPASAVISFAEKLEDDTAAFYRILAGRFTESEGQFLSYAEESKRDKILIVRTYRETITDALEACFCFRGMNLKGYSVRTSLSRDTQFADALSEVLRLEKNAIMFYSDAARLSAGLLATISTFFKRMAEKREMRRQRLESLLQKPKLREESG